MTSPLSLVARPDHSCHDGHMDATVVLGKQGRLVLPAAVRAHLGLDAGDELHLCARDGQIVLSPRRDAVAALQALTAGRRGGRSVVDELLEERRREVEAEG